MNYLGAQVVRLGALSPDLREAYESEFFAIDALGEQAISDITTLARQGVDVTAFKNEYDAIADSMVALRVQLETIDDGQAGQWSAQADEIRARYESLLERLVQARSRASERLQYQGLAWGLGAAAIAAGVSWWVWRNRRKRVRR